MTKLKTLLQELEQLQKDRIEDRTRHAKLIAAKKTAIWREKNKNT